MSDLISRQAAIKICNSAIGLWEGQLGVGALVAVRDNIADLPFAEPEVIRCKDCKHIQTWRSEESAKKFGQIYECARSVLNCPKPEDFCSYAEMRGEQE